MIVNFYKETQEHTFRTKIVKLHRLAVASIIAMGWLVGETNAFSIPIINPGFEDVSGQTVFNEFTFGEPEGWDFYDPNNIIPDAGTFTGTLEPNGTDFFNTTAPEGNRVGILFNSGREGEGEYGYAQTLAAVLQANTEYSLTVEVGNIASGTAQNGTFFNLNEFPGYRVELLAGGVVIAQDNNSLTIPEAEFATLIMPILVGATHAQLGQNLGIRLVNLNVIPDGFTQGTSPDLEVDFDDVVLSATAIPEPTSIVLLTSGLAAMAHRLRAHRWRSPRQNRSWAWRRDACSRGRLVFVLAVLLSLALHAPASVAWAATFTITQYIQDNGGAELFEDEFDDGVEPPAGPKTADDYRVNGSFSNTDERTDFSLDPGNGGVLDLVTGQGKVDPGDIERVIGADVKNSAFFFSAGTAGWVQAWFVNSAPDPGSGYGLLIEDFGPSDDFALLRILNAGPGPIALFEHGVTGVLAPPVPLNGVLDGSGTIGLRLDLDASGFVTASIDTGGGFADPFGVSSELQLLGATTHTGGFGAAEVIPEPGTLLLFGSGLAGVARWRIRNSKVS